MDNLNWPLGFRGEDFYKILEWSFIGQEVNKYLDDKYAYYFPGRKPEARIFDDFIGYALKDVSLNALNKVVLRKLKLTYNPKHTMETIWENLGDCLLDDNVDTKLMPQVVLKFLDNFALNNGIENPYSMEEITKISEAREKRGRVEAWEIMKAGSVYQKRLTDGSSVSDEIDAILEKHHITLVLSNTSEVKSIEDVDFVCKVNGDEPNSFAFLQDKSHITNDFLALRAGIATASLVGPIHTESTKKDSDSFVASEPRLVDVVMNLGSQLNGLKRKVNKKAKIAN